jgi:hypothetical protein
MPLFPVSGDDPAFISFYFGDDYEDFTFKRAKEQPDEAAMVSLARWSFENGCGLIDRERCLLNRKSTITSALFKMGGVVESLNHRTASKLGLR